MTAAIVSGVLNEVRDDGGDGVRLSIVSAHIALSADVHETVDKSANYLIACPHMSLDVATNRTMILGPKIGPEWGNDAGDQ